MSKKNTSLFPMFLKLEGRRCLVVGAGAVGESKIESLLLAGARVRVIAPNATSKVQSWAQEGKVFWSRRRFRIADLDRVFLVIAATNSARLHQRIFEQASRSRVLCNAVDEPERCDFYYPAVVRRGNFQIAISTGGQSPALAQRLRRTLETQFGPEYGDWVEELGKRRRELFGGDVDPEVRRDLLHRLAARRWEGKAVKDRDGVSEAI
jgi:precorrin-2 dehydrogenase / sirohydrochlorin ferrochelatase